MHNPTEAIAAGRRLAGRQTQEELAERLTDITGKRWTRDMVASLELGRKTFDVNTLVAVSRAQELPIEFYLFGPADRARGVYRRSLSRLAGNPNLVELARSLRDHPAGEPTAA